MWPSVVAIRPICSCSMSNSVGGPSIGMPIGVTVCVAVCRRMAIGFSTIAAVQLGCRVLGGGQVDCRVGLEEAHRLQPEACYLDRHHGPVLWACHMGSPEAVPEHRVFADEWAVLQDTGNALSLAECVHSSKALGVPQQTGNALTMTGCMYCS